MKKILVVGIAVVLFASCKKDKDEVSRDPSVTITMSPKFMGGSVTPPSVPLKLMEYVVDIKNTPDFLLDYGNIGMHVYDGLTLGQFKNIRVVYKNKSDIVYSEMFPNPVYTETEFYPDLDRPATTIDTIQVWADVPGSSTRGRLETDIRLEYYLDESWDVVAKTVKGQTTTFVATTLATAVTATTAPSGVVLSDREVNALTLDATAVGQTLKPKSATIVVDGTYIDETRVYTDSTTFVGKVTYGTTGVVTKTIPLNVPSIASGTTKRFWFRHIPKVMTNGPATQPNLKTTLVRFDYGGADTIARYSDSARSGSDLYLFNSIVKIEDEILTGPITNGIPMIIKRNKAHTIGGPGGLKQVTYAFNQFDLGASSPLRITNIKFKVNGVVATNVTFLNQFRQKIDSITPADTKVYVVAVSGFGQYLPVTNAETIYEIEGTYQGYTDGVDYAKIQLLTDDTQTPATHRYINTGPVAINATTFMSLYSSPTPSPSATVANTLWTDKADGPANSGAPGSGSNAWYNGYWIFKNAGTAPQYWYQ
jgi:hypothetical protein